MTKSATRFVTPLTFEALSGGDGYPRHVRSGRDRHRPTSRWGPGVGSYYYCPGTANFIGKMAHGIGDDFLSTCVLAATAKILVCPSMNTRMLRTRRCRKNLSLLKKRGFIIMEPGQGALACGTEGPGRLPEPDEILQQAKRLLSNQDLAGLKILITAGPTTEPIRPCKIYFK